MKHYVALRCVEFPEGRPALGGYLVHALMSGDFLSCESADIEVRGFIADGSLREVAESEIAEVMSAERRLFGL